MKEKKEKKGAKDRKIEDIEERLERLENLLNEINGKLSQTNSVYYSIQPPPSFSGQCIHEWTGYGGTGGVYCSKCGERMPTYQTPTITGIVPPLGHPPTISCEESEKKD